jgi:tetratricopeptide (TPR) repeat protein
MTHPRPLLAVLFALAALLATSAPARADEIVYLDPDTCERKSVRAHEIVAETWTEVQYREKERAPVKTVPTSQVVEVRRSASDTTTTALTNAVMDLERGVVSEAREALSKICAGGWKVSLETGERSFRSYSEGDPPGGKKRPTWVSEYAHFFYAKALVMEGLATKKAEVLEEALLALADLPIPGGDGKARTGGFLARFKEGNSRWFAEALLWHARALTGLSRYDEAAGVYDGLYESSIRAPIGARWAYEAKLGPGEIAKAQGKTVDAANAYAAAGEIMLLLLKSETRECARKEIGRYYSRARIQAAKVKLEAAIGHASKAELEELRSFVEKGSPEALRRTLAGRPPGEIEVLVAGARDPEVQAVSQNILGLAFLNENRFDEAILAFRTVTVAYFQVADQPPFALYHLAKAAEGAEKGAKGPAKQVYEVIKSEALRTLRDDYPGSPWARK